MKKRTNRTNNTTPLKEAFDDMLNSYHLKKKYKEMKLISSWESVMGAPIASRTSKIYIKEGKLFVQLTSAPLKKELAMGKTRILDLLEKEMEERVVNEIFFL